MAQGQDVDQRAQAQTLGALGDGRQQDTRRRRHAERRRVMFGDMIGVEAAAVVDLGQFEPAFVELRKARIATVDVVEDSEFHVLFPCWKRRLPPMDVGARSALLGERIVRIDQDECDPAEVRGTVDPGVVGRLLDDDIAGLEMDFRVVQQHVDLA